MKNTVQVRARTDPERARAALQGPLPFGKVFADLMLQIRHDRDQDWHVAAIVPFGPIELSPAAKVLHYGQEIFEGLKAYPWPGGEVALFRPELNAARLNRSARRMTLPEIPESLQLAAYDALVDALRAWVPRAHGTSLYLRPTLIGVDASLGVAPSSSHLFFVLACPVGPYFSADAAGISVWIEESDVRACPGGVGQAKTGGNYAAGLAAQRRARQAGFDQVLFLDGRDRRYIEEMNGMNVFLVRGDRLCTPPTGDTILEGITRRSILELAPELGIEAEERPLAIEEVLGDVDSGRVTECFTSGTGAGITPVAELGFRGARHRIGKGGLGPVARRLTDALEEIRAGVVPDHRGWMRIVPPNKVPFKCP